MTEAERAALQDFRRGNPLLAQGDALKTRVQTLLAERDRPAPEPWLPVAEAPQLASCPAVARIFRQDADAIPAALITLGRTGPCAGQICRVKRMKRLGYGRAKRDLLRQRIWHRMVASVSQAGSDRPVRQPAAA